MDQNILDIVVVETYNSQILAIGDVSKYSNGQLIQNPYIEITPPGFPKVVSTFTARQINVFNSSSLNLTDGTCTSPLPDGVWKLRYSIQPNYENYVDRTFLRIDQIKERFDAAFLKVEITNCDGKLKEKVKKNLDLVEAYLQTAMAAANKCNEKLAIDLYIKASKMLDRIDC